MGLNIAKKEHSASYIFFRNSTHLTRPVRQGSEVRGQAAKLRKDEPPEAVPLHDVHLKKRLCVQSVTLMLNTFISKLSYHHYNLLRGKMYRSKMFLHISGDFMEKDHLNEEFALLQSKRNNCNINLYNQVRQWQKT